MKIAKVLKIENVNEKIQVYVKCPICNEIHIHGLGTKEKPQKIKDAIKLSHCLYKACETYRLEEN